MLLCISSVILRSQNKVQIQKLIDKYVTNIVAFKKDPDNITYQSNLYDVFSSIDAPHYNDFPNYKYSSTVRNYLTVINNNSSTITSFAIDQLKLFECSNVKNDKKYSYATVKKTLKVNEVFVEYLLFIVIDVNDTVYKIDGIFEFTPSIKKKFLSSCIDLSYKRYVDFFYDQIKIKLEKADQFYAQKKYRSALNLYEYVQENEPTNDRAIHGIQDCKKLIKIQDYITTIENLTSKRKFEEAGIELREANNRNIRFNSEWESGMRTKIKLGIKQNSRNYLEKIGNSFCKSGRYSKAKKIYDRLLKEYPNNQNYLIALETCKKNDKGYVLTEIKKVDHIVYKRRLKTHEIIKAFKVYYKYEDTNLLTGRQYDFMTRALISKKKNLKKSMRFSNTQVKRLVQKYYDLAKRKGIDNSELKILI